MDIHLQAGPHERTTGEEGSFEVSLTSICLAHCFQPDSWANAAAAGLSREGGPQHVNSFERKSLLHAGLLSKPWCCAFGQINTEDALSEPGKSGLVCTSIFFYMGIDNHR